MAINPSMMGPRNRNMGPPPPIEPATEADLDPVRDTSGPIRIGKWILVVGFGAFVAWAAYAPLGEGVPTTGQVMIETKRKPVQHRMGGIVREVHVKEGQMVKEGDVLFKLEEESVRAQFETSRQQYLAFRASESRLAAEQNGEAAINFHPDLMAAASDSFAQRHMANHQKLFTSRLLAIQSEQAALEQGREAQEAQLAGMFDVIKQRASSLAIVQEQYKQMSGLAREGYVPRNRQLDLEKQVTDLESGIRDLQANIDRTQKSIEEMKLRAMQRRNEYRKEVDQQLAEIRREVEAAEERFRASSKELDRTEIKAPATGQVVGLQIQSPGAVVPGGMKIAEVVPDDEALIIEAKVPPQYVDRIRVGNEVDVRFSVFANTPQLVVPGRLETLSTDLVSDPPGMMRTPGGPPEYYLARVNIDNAEARNVLKHRKVVPGMPTEIVIKTGERSFLRYLMRPLTKRIAASLKEE